MTNRTLLQVQSRVIYPGAGYIAMAIEAASQNADKSKTISGFELRDVQINRVLQIPDSEEGVETMLHMRPWRIGSQSTAASYWNEFTVYSYDSNFGWQDHARGLIITLYVSKQSAFGTERESEKENESHRKEYLRTCSACKDTADPDEFYDRLETNGMQFGPAFRNMLTIRYGQKRSVCEIRIPDTKAQMPYEFEFKHVIHPITLDNIFHTSLPARVGSGQAMKCAYVPVFIQSLYVSVNISNKPGTLLRGYSTVEDRGNGSFAANIAVSDSKWQSAQFVIKGLELKSLPSQSNGDSHGLVGPKATQNILHSIWKEDVDFIDQSLAKSLFTVGLDSSENERGLVADLERTALVYMRRFVPSTDPSEIKRFSSHHQLFFSWMQSKLHEFGGLITLLDSASEDKLIMRTRNQSIDGRIMCQVGDHLRDVFSGQLEPLEVLLENNLLHEYYTRSLGLNKVYHQLSVYMDTLVHKYPNTAILEIGAGTGGATLPVLQVIGGNDDSAARFQSYTFTDISSGFFENAEKKFDAWKKHICYRKLNIENDPQAQGFENHSYDIIIAANVLHATTEMDETIANVRKLLKPGGKLVMIEITQRQMRLPMIMGILPGWWSGEDDGRHNSPTLSAKEWDKLLKRQGYSGIDFRLPDYSEPRNELFSIIVSTVCEATESSPSEAAPTLIIKSPGDREQLNHLSQSLIESLSETTPGTSVATLDTLPKELGDHMCIVLLELNSPILSEIKDEEFDSIKRLILTSKGVLWVTRGGAMDSPTPETNLIVGLARSIRAENPDVRLATFDLSSVTPESAGHIYNVVRFISATQPGLSFHSRDFEFVERNGKVFISRLQQYKPISQVVGPHDRQSMIPFYESKSPLKLEIRTPGLLDTLQFAEDLEVRQPLLDDEVEIEVKATGLNFHDIMVAMGKVSGALGNECTGMVIRVGQNVTRFKIGDRVWTGTLGAYKSRVRSHESLFQLMPDGMSYETGASLVMVYMTAYYSLFDIARIQKGESVLIHAAAGGVGQAAIILAKTCGAEIFVTAGSETKKRLLIDHYGIPEDHIFNSRDLAFAKGVMRLTNNRGVDVILNSLTGEALRLSFHCLAMHGRFVEIGKTDILGNTGLDMAPFLRNVTFSSVDLALILEVDIPTASRIFADMAALLRKGTLKEIHPITVYDYSEIEKAFRIMQAGAHVGKIVLKPTKDSLVPV